jgi:TRAP transporter 4TM/12TM fusion protein
MSTILSNPRVKLAALIAVLLSGFHILTAGFGQYPDLIQRAVHVCGALALAYLTIPAAKGTVFKLLDWVCFGLAIAVGAYVVLRYETISSINYYANDTDIILGTIAVLLILEAARRVVGWFLPCLALLCLGYALLGNYIPGSLGHRGLSFFYTIEVLFTTQRGLWGVVTGISATVISVFVIFGALLFACGGGKTFMDISLWLGGRSTGGAAKVAVVASGLFGSLSGSAAANIATTGTFTIPMMINRGYSRKFASAVEAVASSGGQLMPPIMGAGAFVMAELLGISYTAVAAAALIPAFLFYGAVFLSVHIESARLGYVAVPKEDIPKPSEFLQPARIVPLAGPLGAVIALLVWGYTPTFAGFWGIVVAVGLFLIFSIARSNFAAAVRDLVEALVTAGKGIVTIAVLIVCAQIIVGLMGSTGLGVKISAMIVSLGSGQLALSLVLAMMLSIILGMGLPTTAAYLLAASVVAPALAQLGITDISAHLFIFYFAILAGLTPPVCGAVFIAAGIAQTPWTGTLISTFRIAATAFLLPFLFVRYDALLLSSISLEGTLRILQALLIMGGLCIAAVGDFRGAIPPILRLLIAGCCMTVFLAPDAYAAAGAATLIITMCFQFYRSRQNTVVVSEDG